MIGSRIGREGVPHLGRTAFRLRDAAAVMAGVASLQLSSGSLAATEPAVADRGAVPHHRPEGYPVRVIKSRSAERALRETAKQKMFSPDFIFTSEAQLWDPGQVVRVAFKGGSEALRAQIEAAAAPWVASNAANLKLSFRKRDGTFRTWSPNDRSFAAEIRIAFDDEGLWSMVGSESTNRRLEGGRPGDPSMSLEDFDSDLPFNWESTVLHEFGHALGFEHEHQSSWAACGFRFDDDPGYVPTTDDKGWYTVDMDGRRPGLYTYLGGYDNYWSPEKVDGNLRAIDTSSAFARSKFDNASIMKYYFPEFYFAAGAKSRCYSDSENEELSDLDRAGARKAYPRDVTRDLLIRRTLTRQLLTKAASDPEVAASLRKRFSSPE